MKKFLCLITLLFCLVSCSDEFGIKSLYSDLYLLLPNSISKISDINSSNDALISSEAVSNTKLEEYYIKYSGYNKDTIFHKSYMQNEQNSYIYNINFYEQTRSRRSYSHMVTFKITGISNGTEHTEQCTKEIHVNYLEENKYYYQEIEIQTMYFGSIKALYVYELIRTI